MCLACLTLGLALATTSLVITPRNERSVNALYHEGHFYYSLIPLPLPASQLHFATPWELVMTHSEMGLRERCHILTEAFQIMCHQFLSSSATATNEVPKFQAGLPPQPRPPREDNDIEHRPSQTAAGKKPCCWKLIRCSGCLLPQHNLASPDWYVYRNEKDAWKFEQEIRMDQLIIRMTEQIRRFEKRTIQNF